MKLIKCIEESSHKRMHVRTMADGSALGELNLRPRNV